ncbi:MAG TPA: AAA family ATPase [Candidatus Sumerlaeota bacterium]|nr:AAA family ATPase [Candidatus Sumerlaeota bacterium]HPS03530.1 AAA family ATPase [Candidatus Sumerlaeota bacterium]
MARKMSSAPTYSLPEKDRLRIAVRLAQIRLENPDLASPRQINQRLTELGYRGQAEAREAASVLAYRHFRRLWRVFVEKQPVDTLPARSHTLFLGASGCGKTFLVQLLFQKMLGLPTVMQDITQFSQTGFVGREVQEILADLVQAAGDDPLWASCGIVCLDEVDKLCSQSSPENGLAGRDVSGRGVQRELLGLLSAPAGRYRSDGPLREMTQELPLGNVLFVLCGAFAGIAQLAPRTSHPGLGFGTAPLPPAADRKHPRAFSRLDRERLRDPQALVRYGLMPELAGRLNRIVPLQPLEAPELRAILHDTVLDQYRHEFNREGIALELAPQAEEHLVSQALLSQSGARGLHGALTAILEPAAYECLGCPDVEKVHLTLQDNRVVAQYTRRPTERREKKGRKVTSTRDLDAA